MYVDSMCEYDVMPGYNDYTSGSISSVNILGSLVELVIEDMTISSLVAEDMLLSRISSMEGSIVVVRKLKTCEAVLFSAGGLFVEVVIPNELLSFILSADEEICNYEIES